MGAQVNEQGILTFSALTMKQKILEQVPIKDVKDVNEMDDHKALGYTSQEWFFYTTEKGEKLFRMHASDVQTLMWQQLTSQYTQDELKTRWKEINAELKSRWAALKAQLPQIYVV